MGPRAALYIISWGFKRIEAIMKAASQSCRMPCLEKEAAMGIVPYMHSGEAIPSRQAGTTPRSPHLVSFIRVNILWIRSLAKTLTAEPMAMPSTQYQKICRNWRSK